MITVHITQPYTGFSEYFCPIHLRILDSARAYPAFLILLAELMVHIPGKHLRRISSTIVPWIWASQAAPFNATIADKNLTTRKVVTDLDTEHNLVFDFTKEVLEQRIFLEPSIASPQRGKRRNCHFAPTGVQPSRSFATISYRMPLGVL